VGSFYQGFAHITCYKIKFPKSNKRPFIYSHSKIDWVTCARYFNHKTLSFQKIMTKEYFIFGFISFLMISKVMVVNMTMDFYGLCTYVWSAHKWRNWMVQIDMYISSDVSLLKNSLQNAQQYQHMCTCNN
jgi:hypothetical protein